MSNANELELKRLNKLIADLQWKIFQGGGFQAATTSILVQSLGDAERNLAGAEHAEITERKLEEHKQQQEIAGAILRAEREANLSQAERREFGSFLLCEFFKRSDFERLENFYINTWDRLSEEGKAEMSYRVWEGVRHEEYRFSELPESVKEKEAQRLRDALGTGNRGLETILEIDRRDFINSWDAGRKKESYQVLDRTSFANSVSVSPAVEPHKAAVNLETSKVTVVENEKKVQKPEVQPQSVQAKASRQDLKLEDMPDISLTATDVKAPLSNLSKPAGPQFKTH